MLDWKAHVHADFIQTFGGSSGNGNQQHLQQNLNFFTRKNHGQTICLIKALLLLFVWWRCNSPSHGRCKKLSRHESGRILVTRWLQWLDGPTEQMTWMVTRWLQWLDGITEQMLSGMVEDITSGYQPHLSSMTSNALLLKTLVGHFLEELCVNPTFIINHPEIGWSNGSGWGYLTGAGIWNAPSCWLGSGNWSPLNVVNWLTKYQGGDSLSSHEEASRLKIYRLI